MRMQNQRPRTRRDVFVFAGLLSVSLLLAVQSLTFARRYLIDRGEVLDESFAPPAWRQALFMRSADPEGAALCNEQRYAAINSMRLRHSDFIPYKCYNHNDQFVTVFGMQLKGFDSSALRFWLNGIELDEVDVHSGHQTFVFNAPIQHSMVVQNEEQFFTYGIGPCTYSINCSNYYDHRRDEMNMCVYTGRSLDVIQPFLDFYRDLVDRIFIYNTEREHAESFSPLRSHPKTFDVTPWYVEELRDLNVSPKVYDALVAHNYRNYSRDAQKVQTNHCLYKNRGTNMVLMVDDDEYLNFHNKQFYRTLYKEVGGTYDDIVLYRNYCNTTISVETRMSTVLSKSNVTCEESRKKRLEKALVFPRNCRIYEIHRCISKNSYSLRHLNIYLAHSPYQERHSTASRQRARRRRRSQRQNLKL